MITNFVTKWREIKGVSKAHMARQVGVKRSYMLMRVRSALMDYEDETRLGGPAPERRCMICGAPVSKCCC